ncbi:MAG: permease [Geminicoccaceae bacterium]|nr:permease [Geminicoccaceae bacterium]
MIVSLWRHAARGVRALVNPNSTDRDLDDEVTHYLDSLTDDLVAAGHTPADARRLAAIRLGSTTTTREQVRAYGWENVIESIITDARYSARRLRTSPGFTTVTAVTLALGIGSAAAIFSAVNPILFEPLPYPSAQRIVSITDRGTDGSPLDVTFGTYREILARNRTFDALAVLRPWQPTAIGAAEPERLDGQRVSANYLRVLGVSPAIGRDFSSADDAPGAPNVVILADGIWRRRFGSDVAIVGKEILLDGTHHTVVGVMPRTFENVLAPSAEVWTPLRYDPALPLDGREWGHHLRMVGRLRPNTSVDQAGRELNAIASEPVPELARVPWASLRNGLTVASLHVELTRSVRPVLLAMLGAVGLLLVMACVNVTNLLVGRGVRRRGELAMRTALGAGRGRLVRQLVTESVIIAGVGGALGLVVAEVGVRALVALSPLGLPRAGAVRLDLTVVGVGVAVTTLIGLAVGTLPALHLTRGELHDGIREGSRRTSGGHRGVRSALVVAEVSLALVLLVGAGLLLRSVHRLLGVSAGFDSSHVLAMQVQTAGPRFAADDATQRFFARALDAVRDVPGVVSAGLTSQLPLSGDVDRYGAQFDGVLDTREDRGVFMYAVSPGYVETMRVPHVAGRLIEMQDVEGAPISVLVSRSLATRMFPGRDPIGQRLRVGATDQPWYTIAGVVGDVKQTSLADADADAVYVPMAQWYVANRARWLVVRGTGDVAQLAPALRAAIWSADKDQPIARVALMGDLVAASAAGRRFALIVLEAFALTALVLAGTGIYGVLSAGVTERRREIGVRAALGATRGTILRMVVGRGVALTAMGIAIGLAGAFAASGALGSLLFGVTRLDAVTYLGTIAMLIAVSGVACWVPASRASRVDPTITLRAD